MVVVVLLLLTKLSGPLRVVRLTGPSSGSGELEFMDAVVVEVFDAVIILEIEVLLE